MDHDTSVGQSCAHALLACGQEETAHTARLSDAPSRHRGRDVLHRVVDAKASRDAAA